MISRLYEFLADNNLSLNNPLVHEEAIDSDHTKELDIKLADGICSWTINCVIQFPVKMLTKGVFRNCDIAIRLVHPICARIWICRSEDDGKRSYVISCGNDRTECDNLEQVNYELKKTYSYDARHITMEDIQA